MKRVDIRRALVLMGMSVTLSACIVATPAPPPQSGSHDDDAGTDETDPNASEGNGGSEDAGACVQSGTTACDDVLRAVCAMIVSCCSAPTAACESWASNANACMGYWVTSGYDCSSAQYAVDVCPDETKSCASDVAILSCASVYASTLQWSRSCTTFWAQF
jgi:hypothetical protein